VSSRSGKRVNVEEMSPVSRTADSGGQRNSRDPICSIGFLNPSRLRGRSLSSAATQSRSSALCAETDEPPDQSSNTWSVRVSGRRETAHTATGRWFRCSPASPAHQQTRPSIGPRSAPGSTSWPGPPPPSHAVPGSGPAWPASGGRRGGRPVHARRRRGAAPDTVDGDRPRSAAMVRMESPRARPSAISSRCANVRHRPLRPQPRRGRTPPAAASQRLPCLR